ncbi:MAG: hypothetical protein WDO73_16790 [Ignavibacteriota bacterium]
MNGKAPNSSVTGFHAVPLRNAQPSFSLAGAERAEQLVYQQNNDGQQKGSEEQGNETGDCVARSAVPGTHRNMCYRPG